MSPHAPRTVIKWFPQYRAIGERAQVSKKNKSSFQSNCQWRNRSRRDKWHDRSRSLALSGLGAENFRRNWMRHCDKRCPKPSAGSAVLPPQQAYRSDRASASDDILPYVVLWPFPWPSVRQIKQRIATSMQDEARQQAAAAQCQQSQRDTKQKQRRQQKNVHVIGRE